MPGRKTGKSRSGCHTCKLKRRKCDEQKPYCLQCANRGVQCGGYTTKFKWRACHDDPKPVLGLSATGDRPRPTAKQSANHEPLSLEPTMHAVRALDATAAPPTTAATDGFKPEQGGFKPDQGGFKPEQGGFKSEQGGFKSDQGGFKPEQGGFKSDQGGFKPEGRLLLQDHLELASLLVAGKSARDLKFDNELLAQGIDPTAYGARPQRRRLVSAARSAGAGRLRERAMQRSYSHGDQDADPVQFRASVPRPYALDSLAEAAVDEMRRLPAASPQFEVAFLKREHASPRAPKELKDILTPHESMSDLNLTPSLSALLNHVFTDDKPESPFSPLELSVERAGDAVRDGPPPAGAESDASAPLQLLAEVALQLEYWAAHWAAHWGAHLGPAAAHLAHTSEQLQLLFLYSSYTCGIMSIKAGAAENPWRNVVVAQAHKYLFLFNSIASMTLFHLAGNTRLGGNAAALRSKGYFHMKKCILELASRLSKIELLDESQGLPADVALATCLNLAVSESWDTHTSSGIAHLKGAKSMIQKVLQMLRPPAADAAPTWLAAMKRKLVMVSDDEWDRLAASRQDDKLYVPRNLQLLFNTWVYFEVLSQMTSHLLTDDKGIDLVATITKIMHTMHPDDSSPRSEHDSIQDGRAGDMQEMAGQDIHIKDVELSLMRRSSSLHSDPRSSYAGSIYSNSGSSMGGGYSTFFEKLEMLDNDYVDPLLGCAQSLFLIMGRVASLIARVRRADKKSRNALVHITQAADLRKLLLDWKPAVSPQLAELQESPELSTWDLYSCMATAEAYRHATLLYLYQAVPEVALVTPHQLAEKIFVLLAAIPLTSNLHITHIFPLLVASCEATPGEEREWCETRWAMLSERIWIGNIDRALEVVKEVWRRTDEMLRKALREVDEISLGAALAHGFMPKFDACASVVGISSRCHWGAVMREWEWEVLLA